MSFDSSLRAALLSAPQPIPVDTDQGLTAVTERVRSANRRRLSVKLASLLMLALALLRWPTGDPMEPHIYVPPAQEHEEVVPRPQVPDRGRLRNRPQRFVPTSGRDGRANGGHPSRATLGTRGRELSGNRPAQPDPRSRTTPVAPPNSWSRVVEERYEVKYFAGTHVGESGGSGCWQGAGATGSNDCMPFRVAQGESQFEIDVLSDDGSTVGIQIYEYYGGETIDHGVFCGASGPIAVHPEADLSVRIETSSRCSEERPTTGQIVLRFR